MSDEMRLLNCDISVRELDEIVSTDPESYPTADGTLIRRNGAAKMKQRGPWQLHPYRKGYTRDNNVLLELYDEDSGMKGDLEFTPEEAARVGIALLSHAEDEYDD